jgi:hypothetical protein
MPVNFIYILNIHPVSFYEQKYEELIFEVPKNCAVLGYYAAITDVSGQPIG